jgi:hypothetical protein
MKQTFIVIPFFILLILLVLQQVFGQVQLPVPSPAASVSQTFGVTKVIVDYSSPAVRGRKIWGELVPFGQLWRTGANSPTQVSFSTPVRVGGNALPAGTYTLMTIPNEKSWTVIFSKDEKKQGIFGYDQAEDVARFEVIPTKAAENREHLLFTIIPNNEKKATLRLEWENLRLDLPLESDTHRHTLANIEASMKKSSGLWYDYAISAEYYAKHNYNLETANQWASTSLALQPSHFFNKWVMAKVLAAQNDFAGAARYAKEARAFGEENSSGFYEIYKEEIAKSFEEWSKKGK